MKSECVPNIRFQSYFDRFKIFMLLRLRYKEFDFQATQQVQQKA